MEKSGVDCNSTPCESWATKWFDAQVSWTFHPFYLSHSSEQMFSPFVLCTCSSTSTILLNYFSVSIAISKHLHHEKLGFFFIGDSEFFLGCYEKSWKNALVQSQGPWKVLVKRQCLFVLRFTHFLAHAHCTTPIYFKPFLAEIKVLVEIILLLR